MNLSKMKVQILLGVVLLCFTEHTFGDTSTVCQGQSAQSLQPNPDDCHKFFICMNEIAIAVTCPGTQKFDLSAGTCLESTSPDCQVGELIPEGIECPEKTEETIFISYPNNCEKFLKCYNGRLKVFNCPKGLHWHHYFKRCDWPGIANCVPEDKIPTVAPGECDPFEDPYNPTTFPHPTNCETFYKCQGGLKLEVPCPYEKHYSTETKRCEYPAVAKCAVLNPGSTSTPNGCPRDDDPYNPTHLPHPTDCTKFYKCESSTRKLMTCPPGQSWNDAMKYCDFTETTICGTITPPLMTPGSICSPNGDELLAMPGYCSQYIQCFGGLVYVRSCGSGLLWNDVGKTCDYDYKSECLVEETTQSPDRITSTPADIPNCSIGMYHSDPNDCSKFYQCSNGDAYLMTCAPGLHWNSDNQVCDWPSNVRCSVQATTNSPTEETSIVTGPLTPSTTESTSTSTEKETTSIVETLSTEEASITSVPKETTAGTETSIASTDTPPSTTEEVTTLVSEETTATQNIGTDITSPTTEHITTTNIEEESTPPSTTEEIRTTTEDTTPIPTVKLLRTASIPNAIYINEISLSNCSNSSIIIHQSHPTNRFRFYECHPNGLAYEMACPDNQQWQSQSNNCSRIGYSPANLTNDFFLNKLCPPDADLKTPIRFEDPRNSSKYYECENGWAKSRKCADSLNWNKAEQFCDWPDMMYLGQSEDSIHQYRPDEKDCTRFVQRFGSQEIRVTCPAGLFWNAEIQACDSPKTVRCNGMFEYNRCPGLNEYAPNFVVFADPKDCRKFTKCNDGFGYSMQCPRGLHWNRELGHCDWPEFVRCEANYY